MKKLRIALIGASLMTLVACSTTNPNGADVTDGAATDANGGAVNGVVAGGAGDADNFGGNNNGNVKAMQVGNQSYYFDFNKYDVHSDDVSSINVQAGYLATHNKGHILLAGNTDERGSREYNIALGNKRAQSVAQQLKAGGINDSQITSVSYGAEKPAAIGHDESAWSKNRRVDLTYQTPITLDKK